MDSLRRAPTDKMQEVKHLYQNLQIHVGREGSFSSAARMLSADQYMLLKISLVLA